MNVIEWMNDPRLLITLAIISCFLPLMKRHKPRQCFFDVFVSWYSTCSVSFSWIMLYPIYRFTCCWICWSYVQNTVVLFSGHGVWIFGVERTVAVRFSNAGEPLTWWWSSKWLGQWLANWRQHNHDDTDVIYHDSIITCEQSYTGSSSLSASPATSS